MSVPEKVIKASIEFIECKKVFLVYYKRKIEDIGLIEFISVKIKLYANFFEHIIRDFFNF